MPSYYHLGKIPPKRHTQFKKPDGSFYPEEIFGTEAFSGVYSTLYHNNLPTRVSHIKKLKDLSVAEWETDVHRHHHLRTKGVESAGSIEVPKRYRNDYGQLTELAPFSDRDFRLPSKLVTHDDKGEFEVRVKIDNELMSYVFDYHPFDVVGWDGYLYPWIFNVNDFEPLTGRVHQPPPVHQTFEAPGFDVLSFVPRKLDYHPEAVPVPYNHSNIDSDEILYYVSGDFSSRRGIDIGSFTLHRRGIHHGPQPGAVEASLGKEATNELAIMVETHKPLKLTAAGAKYDDAGYPFSWLGTSAK